MREGGAGLRRVRRNQRVSALAELKSASELLTYWSGVVIGDLLVGGLIIHTLVWVYRYPNVRVPIGESFAVTTVGAVALVAGCFCSWILQIAFPEFWKAIRDWGIAVWRYLFGEGFILVVGSWGIGDWKVSPSSRASGRFVGKGR